MGGKQGEEGNGKNERPSKKAKERGRYFSNERGKKDRREDKDTSGRLEKGRKTVKGRKGGKGRGRQTTSKEKRKGKMEVFQ